MFYAKLVFVLATIMYTYTGLASTDDNQPAATASNPRMERSQSGKYVLI